MFETVNETDLMKLIQRFSHVTVASEALPRGSDVTALRRFVFTTGDAGPVTVTATGVRC